MEFMKLNMENHSEKFMKIHNLLSMINSEFNKIVQVVKNVNFLLWAIRAVIILAVSVGVIFIITRWILYKSRKINERTTIEESDKIAKVYVNRPYEITQIVFEIIISNTCIIIVMYIYYCIDKYLIFLKSYLGIIMITLIIFAILLNNLLDGVIKQDMIKKENKANIRLISSCSVVMLFLFIKIYFKTKDYDEFLLYYVPLVLGRFIFFDSTISELKKSLSDLKFYVISLIIAVALTGIISWIGIYLQVITADNLFINLIICHIAIICFIYNTKEIIYDINNII